MATDTDRVIQTALAFFNTPPVPGTEGTYKDAYDALEPYRTKPARVGYMQIYDNDQTVRSVPAIQRTDLVNQCLTGCVLTEDELLTAFDPTTDKIEMVDQIMEACHAKMKGAIQDE